MTRKEFLVEAEKCICSDRNLQYGAKLWNAYLDADLGPTDVAIMMCLFKIARLKGSCYGSKDSWVDLIGYAACGGEIAIKI